MKVNKFLYVLILLFVLVNQACGNGDATLTPSPMTETPGAALTPISLEVGFGYRGSWFELFFTDPTNPLASQITGGVDGPLTEAIDAARLSVDVAAYSLSLNSVRNALLRAHDRGVEVRMVMESDNLGDYDPQLLKDAGVPIIGDRREGLMHNKFVIIDRAEVWTGSMNFTDSSEYSGNNNLIRIHSKKVVEDYIKEFEEMFLDDKFGPDVLPATPNPRVEIEGTSLEIYFSPDDGAASSLLSLLDNAQKSIYFLAYSFTSNDLGDVIRTKAEGGLDVAGVMDEEQVNSNIGTEYDAFRQAGLDVRLDGNKDLMHHKVIIIDGKIVVTGSYNFTASAETKNDENLIVIHNAQIAEKFMEEFERVQSQAQPLK